MAHFLIWSIGIPSVVGKIESLISNAFFFAQFSSPVRKLQVTTSNQSWVKKKKKKNITQSSCREFHISQEIIWFLDYFCVQCCRLISISINYIKSDNATTVPSGLVSHYYYYYYFFFPCFEKLLQYQAAL